MRGAVIENVFARDITVGEVRVAVISIDFNYEEGKNGNFTPVARNIGVEKLQSEQSQYAVCLRGFPSAPIENVKLGDCDFRGVDKGNVVENVKGLELNEVKINGADVNRLGERFLRVSA